MEDGIVYLEHGTLNRLQEAAIMSERLFRRLMDRSRSWIPAPTQSADKALYRLIKLTAFDEEKVIRLVDMPFMETIEFTEGEFIRLVYDLALTDPDAAGRILSHPLIEGGLTDEVSAHALILYLEEIAPRAATAIKGLPWVADGITYSLSTSVVIEGTEAEKVWTLVRLGEGSEELILELVSKPWIRDGISNLGEYSTVIVLDVILDYDREAAVRMLMLPIMDTYNRDMASALQRLESARWESRDAFDRELENIVASAGN